MDKIISRNDDEKIIRNFRYKRQYPYSLESIAYDVVKNYDEGDTLVDKRYNATLWAERIRDLSGKFIESSYREMYGNADTSGNLGFNNVTMEKARLELLYKMDWSYNGTFHQDKFISRYPQVFFVISPDKVFGKYWYKVSLGIMRGSENLGTYSRFLTLNECLEFLRNEVETSGKRGLIRHELAVSVEKERKSRKKEQRTDREILASVKPVVYKKVEQILSPGNIENEFDKIRRCVDVYSFYDIMAEYLYPLSVKMLVEAKDFEREQNKAKNMDTFGTEGVFDIDSIVEEEDSEFELMTPEEVVEVSPVASDAVTAVIEPDLTNEESVADEDIEPADDADEQATEVAEEVIEPNFEDDVEPLVEDEEPDFSDKYTEPVGDALIEVFEGEDADGENGLVYAGTVDDQEKDATYADVSDDVDSDVEAEDTEEDIEQTIRDIFDTEVSLSAFPIESGKSVEDSISEFLND